MFKYSYFNLDNPVHISQNSGPTGLALTVVISKTFIQCLEDKVIQEAVTTNLTLLTDKMDVDDSHTRFETVHNSHSFLNILKKHNKAIQYAIEKEDESQTLNYLDLKIINIGAEKYEFKKHCRKLNHK